MVVVVYVYSTTGKTLVLATQDPGASKTLAGWCFDLPISCKGIGEHDCLLYRVFTECVTLLLPPFVRLAVLLCNPLPCVRPFVLNFTLNEIGGVGSFFDG